MGLLNRNYVGTHFGGSLFAMTDPFYMLMMMRNLGPDYIVWDKHSRIDFRRPARGRVWAHFGLGEEQLSTARQQCESGAKFEPTYTIDIVDASGEVVATVDKTLYIRRRPGPGPPMRQRAAMRRRLRGRTKTVRVGLQRIVPLRQLLRLAAALERELYG